MGDLISFIRPDDASGKESKTVSDLQQELHAPKPDLFTNSSSWYNEIHCCLFQSLPRFYFTASNGLLV